MAFTRENSIGNAIHSYGNGEIKIIQNTEVDGIIEANLNSLSTNLIISPTQLISNWQIHDISEMTADNIQIITDMEPEIVILGIGREFKLFPVAIQLLFQQYNIGLEIMDTAAACRTYNFLLNEGRNVVAALLQITPD